VIHRTPTAHPLAHNLGEPVHLRCWERTQTVQARSVSEERRARSNSPTHTVLLHCGASAFPEPVSWGPSGPSVALTRLEYNWQARGDYSLIL